MRTKIDTIEDVSVESVALEGYLEKQHEKDRSSNHRREFTKRNFISTRKSLIISICVMMMLISGFFGVVGVASATDYYVATNRSDSNPGTLAEPWRTIGKANQELQAGDTVYIRGGTYQETIRPARSGNEGNYITYKCYEGETVTITSVTNGADLSNKEYIIVEDLRIIDVSHWIWMKPNSNHNTIRNCYMERSTGWGGIHIEESSYNKILNNTLKTNNGDGICIYFDSHYNLIQGNDISDCVHNLILIWGRQPTFPTAFCKFNIIKDNKLHNLNKHTNLNLVSYADWNLVEDNVIYESHPSGPGLQLASSYNIIRRNQIYHNGGKTDAAWGGIAMSAGIYEGIYKPCISNKIYNNIIYNNIENGISVRDYTHIGDLHDNIFKNNINYKNPDADEQIWYDAASYHNDLWEGNDIFYTTPGQNIISFNSNHGNHHTLSWLESNYPDGWKKNIEANPLFVNEGNFDFHLQSDSPCIDAGTFLTKTTNSGLGTQISVEDTGYFCDGFGITDGDLIQVGSNSPVRITNVDYDNNIITVDQSISWNDNDGVSLPYSGSAPDIGAYEFESGGAIGTISGTVTDKDTGLSIEGAAVTANGHSNTTNNTGGYTITDVPVGNYTVTASVTGYYNQTQENVEVIENQTTEVNFTLSGIATGTTSGTITNTSGAPIQEATVSANEYSNTTNATGGYTITLPVGNYTVTASKTGYFPESQEKVQILEDQTTTVNFQLTEAPDLVGEWHFDEGSGTTATDSSGNGNDGVINRAVYTSSSKLGDYALEFDGNSYVNISDSLSMDFNKSSGTIEFWVKPVNPASGKNQLLVIDSDYEIEFNIQGDGDLFCYPWVDGSLNNYNLVTDPLTAGDWQHVAVTWEFSTKEVKIYVDGVNQTFAIENVPTYWTALASTGDWHIGGSPVKNQYFNGTIDEVKIYSRALSEEEIKADYEAGLEDRAPPETTITSSPDGTITHNDVSFNWIGSDDVTPTSQLVYSYKLENYDSEWSSWTFITSKSYNDLPNDHYTFKVKAKDEAGKEDTTPAKRSFTVLVDLIVTNPNATPDVILDDTDNDPGWGETSQLNVTVTDNSGILSVTINLSQIGGSSVQPMKYIGGNIWSVTTNASVGTAGWNGTAYVPYHLQVNATDIYGNSNTSVSIELMVMKNGDVTGDGIVDDGDGIRLMNHDYYPEDPRYGILSDTVADVTGDGIVDDGDGIRLMNHDYYPEDPRYMLK